MERTLESTKSLVKRLSGNLFGGLSIRVQFSNEVFEISKLGINDWCCSCGASSAAPCAHLKAFWNAKFEESDIQGFSVNQHSNEVARKIRQLQTAKAGV